MTTSSNLVTVVQFGGHWCAVKVDENKTTQFIGKPLTTKISAIAAAQSFAKENSVPFKENAIKFDKPVVTIWRALGCWLPAKIFETNIQGAGKTVESKADAIAMAKQLAIKEGLEFFPSIGESAFEGS